MGNNAGDWKINKLTVTIIGAFLTLSLSVFTLLRTADINGLTTKINNNKDLILDNAEAIQTNTEKIQVLWETGAEDRVTKDWLETRITKLEEKFQSVPRLERKLDSILAGMAHRNP